MLYTHTYQYFLIMYRPTWAVVRRLEFSCQ